jgi:hypothetical protein
MKHVHHSRSWAKMLEACRILKDVHRRALKQRSLWPPSESCQIRIFSFRMRTARTFLGLAKRSLGFLFLTLHLQSLFSISFG